MTSNVAQFNLELDAFIKDLVPELALDVQQKLALDALRRVVKKSPVQTGRFRANWHLSTTPSDAPIDRLDKQPKGSDPAGFTVATSEANVASAQPYGTMYLQNALPYAIPIENGSSKTQAPAGVLSLTVAELQATLLGREPE